MSPVYTVINLDTCNRLQCRSAGDGGALAHVLTGRSAGRRRSPNNNVDPRGGPLFVRCDVCRRYARLYLADIRDTDYRTKTFSCCRCGTDGALAITAPNTETGMTDYRLDQVEGPQHHQ